MTDLLALVGPTASGKTQIAVGIAEKIGAEIVCADSMTIYRGMDVGTAKPDAEARARVPHHMLDLVEPARPFSVARFQEIASEALEGIRARGNRVLVVGGSGLYFRAIVDDLTFPPTDPAVRARIDAEPLPDLVTRLLQRDPEAASFIDHANRRRVVRALEVIEITGRPFSSFRDAWDRHRPVVVAGLEPTAEVLERRIEARLRAMLREGLVEEAAMLQRLGYEHTLTAGAAIAYREAIQVLRGELDEEGFVKAAGTVTRGLARRQLSWFKRDPRVRWFAADDLEAARREVEAYYGLALERSGGPWTS